MKKTFLAAILSIGFAANAIAQTVTVGSGTQTVSYPFDLSYSDARTQILFTADELEALGAEAGVLKEIAFDVVQERSDLINGFTVSAQHTSLTTLSNFVEGGFVELYTAKIQVNATGWYSITPTTNFVWDGESNLLLQLCFSNPTWALMSVKVAATKAVGHTLSASKDGEEGCTLGMGYPKDDRPNVRLTFEPTNAPAPPSQLTATAISATESALAWTRSKSTDSVLLAFSTTGTFGLPEDGTLYTVGQALTGGGQVLYLSAADTTHSHTPLVAATTYYYQAWSLRGGLYSLSATTTSVKTLTAIPYNQGFDADTLPPGWGNSPSSWDFGGSLGSGARYNLWQHASQASLTSPAFDALPNGYFVKFDYRILDYGYDATAAELLAGDTLLLEVATDGANFLPLYCITEANHSSSDSYRSIPVSLADYAGRSLQFRFRLKHNGSYDGDYYVMVDNFSLYLPGSMAYASTRTSATQEKHAAVGSVNNTVLRLEVSSINEGDPLTLDSIIFATTGTNQLNNITSAKLWGGGSNDKFSHAQLLDSTTTVGARLTFAPKSTHYLSPNASYFWLSYDVSEQATSGSLLGAEPLQLYLSGAAHPLQKDTVDALLEIVAPLSGTYIVLNSPSATTSLVNKEFASLQEALSALETIGVGGAVTIRLTAGSYYGGYELNAIKEVSAASSVRIVGEEATLICQPYIYDAGIALMGAKHLTLDSLSFTLVDDASINALSLYKNTQYITIKNCSFTGFTDYFYESKFVVAEGDSICHITVENNTFTTADKALQYSWGEGASDVKFIGNHVEDVAQAVDLVYQKNVSVEGNSITYNNGSGWSSGAMVFVDEADGSLSILNNRFNLNSDVSAVEVSSYLPTGVSRGIIANNMIFTKASGIRVLYSNDVEVVFNNVMKAADSWSSAGNIYVRSSDSITVHSNVLVNASTGGSNLQSTSNTGFISNNNAYHHSNDSLMFSSDGAYYLLKDWQQLGYDIHSCIADPLFHADNADSAMLYTNTATFIGKGLAHPAITHDIDGRLRENTPTIGANELRPVKSVRIFVAGGATTMHVGEVLQLSVEVQPSDAFLKEVYFTLESLQPAACASVSGSKVTALSAGTFTVVGRAKDGQGASDSFSMTATGTTGVARAKEVQVKVYPNPASERIFVKGKNISSLTVYAANGQRVQVKAGEQADEVAMDIQSLSSGVYYLAVADASGISVVKFIKE